jgi:hypothetical protein
MCYMITTDKSENDTVHIDRPGSSFIQNINLDIVGWFASNRRDPRRLSFKINNVDFHANLYSRPDVEEALNPDGSNSIQAMGWHIRVDRDVIYKTRGRAVTLNIFNDGDLVYEKVFYKCVSLRVEEDSSPLVFMHIPKTGGTALRSFVDYAFSEWPVLNVYDDYPGINADKLNKLDSKFLASREILFGHFAYGFNESLINSSKYFVVLREPVDLVNSYINFITNTNYDVNFFDNPLVRYTSGAYGKVAYGELTEAHLDQAIENINTFFYVIQTDKLQSFADEMSDLLGLRKMQISRINEGVYSSKADHLSVCPLLHLDKKLYEYSRHLKQDLKQFLIG